MGHKALNQDLSRFDLWEFCRTGGHLSSKAHAMVFERLNSDQAVQAVRDVQWEMKGVINSRQESTVQIRGTMRVELLCMTCSESVAFDIPLHRNLVLVKTEQAAEEYDEDELDEDDDVVACADYVEVQQWIEDELLLSLPMVPRHPEGCEQFLGTSTQEDEFDAAEESAEQLETRKPFANLDQLIKKTKH